MSLGGGGGSSGTQVQRSEPSSVQAPYLTDLYRQAQTNFQAGPHSSFLDRLMQLLVIQH